MVEPLNENLTSFTEYYEKLKTLAQAIPPPTTTNLNTMAAKRSRSETQRDPQRKPMLSVRGCFRSKERTHIALECDNEVAD